MVNKLISKKGIPLEVEVPTIKLAYHPHVPSKEVNDMPSMTIPDQAKSITEILTRFANGMPLGVDDTPGQYFGEEVLATDVRKLDLQQRKELAIKAQERSHRIRRELEKADQERKEKAYMKKLQDEFDLQQKLKEKEANHEEK